jgi:ubiquinone/menaquinone biosynthesis C-methylase UbiE
MSGTESFWTNWSPYWSYQEDFHLDLEAINKLTVAIIDPVLIVGAGQGLLVEQLRKKMFRVDGVDLDPNMVAYAKKRRGLDLTQADAKNMPFSDNRYKTSIIATGVVDFLDDEEQIRLIIDETFRVTDESGKTFVAFYKYHPKVEKLLRFGNVITDKGSLRFRRLYEMTILSFENPIKFICALKNDANVGLLSALLTLVKTQIFLPKKEKNETKKLARLWQQATNELDNPESLIKCLPEFIPYRNKNDIINLFKSLSLPIHNMLVYDSCTLVQL